MDGSCCSVYPILQFFDDVEEVEWAIEVCKEFDKPIVATMCIGPTGDMRDVSAAECAVRMSRKVVLYPRLLNIELIFFWFPLLVTYSSSSSLNIICRAGADVVGVNCYFDPHTSLETLALMKEGLIRAGLLEKPTYLMAQPLGWHCPGQ